MKYRTSRLFLLFLIFLIRILQNGPCFRRAMRAFSFCPLTSTHPKSTGPPEVRGHFSAQLCFRYLLLSCSLFAWTVGSACKMRNKTVHYLLISRWTGARQPTSYFIQLHKMGSNKVDIEN